MRNSKKATAQNIILASSVLISHNKDRESSLLTGMPAKFDRCVKKVKKKSKPGTNAYAVCNAALNAKKKKKKKKKKV